MKVIKRKLLFIFLLFSLSYTLIYVDQISSSDIHWVDFFHIPLSFAGWIGKEARVEDRVKDILETPYVLSRRYVKDTISIGLSIVYYPDNRIGFHSPEACLGGVGYTIQFKKNIDLHLNNDKIKSLPVVLMHYKRASSEELIAYYYETNGFRSGSYLKFRWQMLKNQIQFKDNSGALVRVSTTIRKSDKKAAKKNLIHFLSDFLPMISDHLGARKSE